MNNLTKEFECPTCAGTEREFNGRVSVCQFCGNRWVRKDDKLVSADINDINLVEQLYHRRLLTLDQYLTMVGYQIAQKITLNQALEL